MTRLNQPMKIIIYSTFLFMLYNFYKKIPNNFMLSTSIIVGAVVVYLLLSTMYNLLIKYYTKDPGMYDGKFVGPIDKPIYYNKNVGPQKYDPDSRCKGCCCGKVQFSIHPQLGGGGSRCLGWDCSNYKTPTGNAMSDKCNKCCSNDRHCNALFGAKKSGTYGFSNPAAWEKFNKKYPNNY